MKKLICIIYKLVKCYLLIGAVQHRDICAVVSLDVRNDFNSVPWIRIDDALCKRKIPHGVHALLRSYMQDRRLLVGDERRERRVTCGVPQGSILGPAMWNAFYDGLLEIQMPSGAQLVAFTDDVAVVGMARTSERMSAIINPATEAIGNWMRFNGLRLVPEKTEAVVLTRKNNYKEPRLILQGHPIPVRRSIRYLGVELDTQLFFTAHVAGASARSFKSALAIGRLMPNILGPSTSKRKLLGSVVNSKLLYASMSWAEEATRTAKNRAAMTRPQRQIALRTIRAYRTVSTEGALLLASIIPADLLTLERKRVGRRLEEEHQGTTAAGV